VRVIYSGVGRNALLLMVAESIQPHGAWGDGKLLGEIGVVIDVAHPLLNVDLGKHRRSGRDPFLGDKGRIIEGGDHEA
jgi:hypothetical protein